MKISFAITVCNELDYLSELIPHLLEHKRAGDEIVILWDSKNGSKNVGDYLRAQNVVKSKFLWYPYEFDGHFSNMKNRLGELCSGDYILQIDADESISEYMIKNAHNIVESNSEVELFLFPRVNTVDGLTTEHIQKWNWNIDGEGRINFPDWQGRLYRRGLKWEGRVHERIVGIKHYSLLPTDSDVFFIQHHKDIKRQEKQNEYYSTL